MVTDPPPAILNCFMPLPAYLKEEALTLSSMTRKHSSNCYTQAEINPLKFPQKGSSPSHLQHTQSNKHCKGDLGIMRKCFMPPIYPQGTVGLSSQRKFGPHIKPHLHPVLSSSSTASPQPTTAQVKASRITCKEQKRKMETSSYFKDKLYWMKLKRRGDVLDAGSLSISSMM
ncbi:hypothetical protein Tco_1091022 [Tanacetum coccineum]|uniref:Uncharacterized protein n=1 Tax=Tanacetum coccineum TaxID=301880 RepID=A0ABQ5I734_9ASTR